MCRHRTLQHLATAILLSFVSCTHVLPWTADWTKPGASKADKQATIDRCHESAIENPAFTMRVYAHAMRDEETDLSFVEFDREESPGTGQTAPNVSIRLQGLEPRLGYAGKSSETLVGRPGLEPGTSGLKARCSAN